MTCSMTSFNFSFFAANNDAFSNAASQLAAAAYPYIYDVGKLLYWMSCHAMSCLKCHFMSQVTVTPRLRIRRLHQHLSTRNKTATLTQPCKPQPPHQVLKRFQDSKWYLTMAKLIWSSQILMGHISWLPTSTLPRLKGEFRHPLLRQTFKPLAPQATRPFPHPRVQTQKILANR